jgi:hypothetical protein
LELLCVYESPAWQAWGGGRGPEEWWLCVCGSPAWQALGAHAYRVDIVQACAGLHDPEKRRSCRPEGVAWQRSCGCKGWEFGVAQPWQAGGSEIPVAPWAYGAGLSMQCQLFFQYMVAWRGLPSARGSECWCFSSLWFCTSIKCVSSFSSKSLNHGGQTVCGCVLVTILDPPPAHQIGSCT